MPEQRPDQLDSPLVPTIMRFMARANTWIYRRSGGRLGATFLKGAPVLLLTTIGRKSGAPRTTPVLYLGDGNNVIVVASKGGLPAHPLWYLNLAAQPRVKVQIKKDEREMLARTAEGAERGALWHKLLEMYPDFESYQRWTDREIPVVVLEPV